MIEKQKKENGEACQVDEIVDVADLIAASLHNSNELFLIAQGKLVNQSGKVVELIKAFVLAKHLLNAVDWASKKSSTISTHSISHLFIVRQQACIQIAAAIYTQAHLRTSLFCFLLYQLSLWVG